MLGNLEVLFTCDGKMQYEMDRQHGVAVMLELYQIILVKRELSCKAKLSIYLFDLHSSPHAGPNKHLK